MRIHLAGNDGYHRDPLFLTQVLLHENSFSRSLLEQSPHGSWGYIVDRLMKICLVNISLTSGGVIWDCLKSISDGTLPREINKEAMNIYLAGGISGNLREFWQRVMKIYCASPKSRAEVVEAMKVYIAGDNNKKKILRETLYGDDFFVKEGAQALSHINVLESYYYLRKNEEFMALVHHFGSFLLDSGAFTFMSGSHKGEIDWDKYVEDYAAFINRHDVKLFFELDIDSVVGLAEVERLRAKLEMLTGKKPIPVWHKNRGKDYFIKMCREYPYVAIGGIVTKEIPRQFYEKAFPWFIQTAHQNGAKIHGLGYTTVANLHKYHFDSVDSTAWLYGNRGGYLYRFNPDTGLMEQMQSPANSRLKSREGAVHNFNEWVKFGEYAEKFL